MSSPPARKERGACDRKQGDSEELLDDFHPSHLAIDDHLPMQRLTHIKPQSLSERLFDTLTARAGMLFESLSTGQSSFHTTSSKSSGDAGVFVIMLHIDVCSRQVAKGW